MELKIRLFFVIASLFSCLVYSQSELQIEIRDSETSEQISYATVRFKGTNRGLIADYNGQFRIPSSQINDIPVLLITSIGYESLEVITSEITLNTLTIVKMKPQIESLDAVIINSNTKKETRQYIKESRKMLAYGIVYRAVNSIKTNLNNKSHSYIGYYRDYQIVDSKYYNLNEGIVEQFDAGILTNKVFGKSNSAALYSFKQNSDFETKELYSIEYNDSTKFVDNADIKGFGGNELSILNVHNPIRNYDKQSFSYVYRLNKEFLQNHEFRKDEIQFIDNEPIIRIRFKNKSKLTSYSHRVVGDINISLKDFAIHSFNYYVYDYDKRNPLFNIKIEYRAQNENMYLNYITFNNRFTIADLDVFKEEKVIFNNKYYKYFEVTFNSDFDEKTLKKSRFKIKHNDRRILIKSLVVEDKRTIRLYIQDYDEDLINIKKDSMKNIEFTIKNINDKEGREIYIPVKRIGYQFREYFVQEVFDSNTPNENLKLIFKNKSLKKSTINSNSGNENYIINSPLQNRKME
ncbi:carboxypeptidase-like regulatory domain-containing protein [Ichthyenterobacterium sp. W332]|uniref:Carboxypeptidase-like regulatory domain-containing protein n=1 Tax=Microcosmobacter mediterraneus TaxID=3075607 RepID=A0ABU2YHV7_9FLAO|nr:carboxypeptidase-like regulatory domain-containing protein [Ichthyenterobacterium sp. W332]MDT0557279.1 carboxypeptidase-like regulatory domain-containing protein [Ichthyenterobacterium sp. W332]